MIIISKTIGFVDYFLNEWHADNYPQWIKEASNGEFEVKYAYGLIDSPRENSLTNKQWADEHGIELLSSIEEIVEKSDYIIVLSPDNSEMHEELCQIPLRGGKPVFVDKTFADSKEIAQRLFDLAQSNNTPMFSTSALRYATEYTTIPKGIVKSLNSFGGGGSFEIYCIHQIEPIVCLMGANVVRVMFTGDNATSNVLMEWSDGRSATLTFNSSIAAFEMKLYTDSGMLNPVVNSDIFKIFIADMIEFFKSGKPPVDKNDTIAIMAIREACIKAKAWAGVWVEV